MLSFRSVCHSRQATSTQRLVLNVQLNRTKNRVVHVQFEYTGARKKCPCPNRSFATIHDAIALLMVAASDLRASCFRFTFLSSCAALEPCPKHLGCDGCLKPFDQIRLN